MVNLVEEAFDVGIQYPAASCPPIWTSGTVGPQTVLDRCRCIMHGATRPKTVRVRLEDRLPFRFQGQFHQALHHSIFHCRNA